MFKKIACFASMQNSKTGLAYTCGYSVHMTGQSVVSRHTSVPEMPLVTQFGEVNPMCSDFKKS